MDERRSLIDAAVQRLLDARASGVAAAPPELPDAEAAYAVQQAVARALGFDDSRCWKSGGASREAEQTHARLPPALVVASPADLRRAALRWRGIEAEVALRLARDVDAALAATLDVERARGLVDAMAVSIEIVDSRWTSGVQAPALAKLADLQSHGALVLGDWVAFDARRDWTAQRCRVRIDDGGGAPAQVFVGTHSMADPAWVLPRWLRHAARDGVVPAGSVVTTGTWCGLLWAAAGDTVEVGFDAIGEARVRL